MRVFLDTNVLVSAFATRGLSADVLRVVLAEHDLIMAEVVIEEVCRVLPEKFGVPEAGIRDLERLLRRYHVEPTPLALPDISLRDAADLPILAAALSSRADVLVSGDKDLLTVADHVQPLRIVSPREFWNLLRTS